jgi:sterol desaturase/sphingolipid hydroxylase (fatty acid hydroxylase superfamily)
MRAITNIAVWVVASGIVAELLGYLLHRLLHCGWIRWLSASHMKHHMLLYGPLQKQRPSEHYMDATRGRLAIGNIGGEWLAPTTVLLVTAVGTFWVLKVTFLHQVIFLATVVGWSFVMFSYLHDRMHVQHFWMERNPLLKVWFLRSRQLHDIHHRMLNDGGLMDKNFGIGFFWFDWLFGTLSPQQGSFNHHGYAAARDKFRYLETPHAPGVGAGVKKSD